MAALDVRNNLVGLVRTIASEDRQRAYELDVTELVCMWFDDLYHPSAGMFIEAFAPPERDRLAKFHAFFDARANLLPKSPRGDASAWLEVMGEAQRVLDDLGWSGGR